MTCKEHKWNFESVECVYCPGGLFGPGGALDRVEKRKESIIGDEELRSSNKILRDALSFYANEWSWVREGIRGIGLQNTARTIHESDVDDRGGRRAREALKAADEIEAKK